jgi:hypothetical protein
VTAAEHILLTLVLAQGMALIAGWFVSLWAVRVIVRSFNDRPCCSPPNLNVLIQSDGRVRRAGQPEEDDDDDPSEDDDDEDEL